MFKASSTTPRGRIRNKTRRRWRMAFQECEWLEECGDLIFVWSGSAEPAPLDRVPHGMTVRLYEKAGRLLLCCRAAITSQ
jgi:hypothetical protein